MEHNTRLELDDDTVNARCAENRTSSPNMASSGDTDDPVRLVRHGDIPVAANIVNRDIRSVVDVSSSGSSITLLRRAMAYQPQSNIDDMRKEVDRVFSPKDSVSIQEINAELMESVNKDPGRVDNMSSEYIAKFTEQFDKNIKPNPSVQGVLDTVLAMCEWGIMHQLGLLFWKDGRNAYSNPVKRAVKQQLDIIVTALDERMPFVRQGVDGDRHGGDGDAPVRHVSALQEHLSLAYNTSRRIVIPPERAKYFPRVVRDLIYYMLMPWFVMKFLSSFVPGDWNFTITDGNKAIDASFNDRRYAEYALYRVVMDFATELDLIYNKHRDLYREMDAFGQRDMSEHLSSSINVVLEFLSRSHIDKHRKKIPEWYQRVSESSDKTKHSSLTLTDHSRSLAVRKQNLVAMLENEKRTEVIANRARTQFWIVTSVLVAFTCVMAFLLSVRNFALVYVGSILGVAMVIFVYIFLTRSRSSSSPVDQRTWNAS